MKISMNLLLRVHTWFCSSPQAFSSAFLDDEEGQATTEYALVLLGAALVALLVVGWATTGGGAGKIGQLFNRVIDSVIDKL